MANNKDNKDKSGKSYNTRRKKWLSGIALAIALMFIIWTIATSIMTVLAYANSGKNKIKAASVASSGNMRGIWVSTVFGLDYPSGVTTDPDTLKAQADAIISDAKTMNMNAIFFQVRPAADSFYNSSYFPWSSYLTGTQGKAPVNGFDPLEYWVSQAHANGIELHAWINPYMVTRHAEDWDTMAASNPAKSTYSQYVIKYKDSHYFDPGEPAVRQLIVDAATEIVNKYDVDGIHMDDYFYPGTDFEDSASFEKYGTSFASKADWRRDNVNQLIRQLNTSLHQADDSISFGVSPIGIWANKSSMPNGSDTSGNESYSAKYCDTVAWAKNEWLDYIAPQVYWNIGFNVADYQILANWWNNVVDGTNVRLYMGMADYRVTDSKSSVWYGTSELNRQLDLNRSLSNIDGEIHFRYGTMAGSSTLMSFYNTYYAKEAASESGGSSGTTPEDNAGDTGNSGSSGTIPGGEQGNSGSGTVGTGTGSAIVTPFDDVKGNWAEMYITDLINAGIIDGMGDGTFQPGAPVTRAQFVKLISAVTGDVDYSDVTSAGFKDVQPTDWYAPYVCWAANAGIVNGMSPQLFMPSDYITREQMAVIINNLSKTADINFGDNGQLITFADASSIDSWAGESVNAAVKAGILNGNAVEANGVTRTYFYPRNNTTRAEAAKVIYILRDKLAIEY